MIHHMDVWFSFILQGVVAGFLQQYGAIPDQLQSGFGVVYNMLSKARELVGLRAK